MRIVETTAGIVLAAALVAASFPALAMSTSPNRGSSTPSSTAGSASNSGGSHTDPTFFSVIPCTTPNCGPNPRRPPVLAAQPNGNRCQGEVRWFYDYNGTLLRKQCDRRYQAEY